MKDYKKKPSIIINPQGYVVTRSVAYDEMVNKDFFSSIIELIQHFPLQVSMFGNPQMILTYIRYPKLILKNFFSTIKLIIFFIYI